MRVWKQIRRKGNKMTNKEIRFEYLEKAATELRNRVPEAFGGMKVFDNRNAFDGKTRKGLQLTCIADINSPEISVGVYFKTSKPEKNEMLYEFMMARKEEIRSMIPYKNVTIGMAKGNGRQPNGERKQYNVLISTKMDVLDLGSWYECCEYHCSVAKALYEYVFIKNKQVVDSLLV